MFRTGKKTAGDDILWDRTFIEEMKADILRRAEAIPDDDEDETINAGKGKKSKLIEVPDDDDVGLVNDVRIVDGEESKIDSDEEDDGEQVKSPEIILELAYLRDPRVFERDAVTRRSKARTDLKAQTGWADEQIEGWRIMLERNPSQEEKMIQKHAFSGNEKGLEHFPSGKGMDRERGGTRGGRGRGGGRGGASAGEDEARTRARKDKNKATKGNHNRKKGHDKKIAGAGMGPKY